MSSPQTNDGGFGVLPSNTSRFQGADSSRARIWSQRIALWIVVTTLAQLVFLCVGCDWELIGDEAEYWTWSRRLDWSYHSKGPLIAFVIRLGTMLAGSTSVALTGSLMPAVRLPALILGALTAWGIYRLCQETTGRARAGWFAAMLLPAIPLFRIGGLLITCDTPLVCCWTWAAVWCFRAIRHDDRREWLAAGVLGALGVLAKYTMLAFPASVGLFLLVQSGWRRELIRPGFWFMAIGTVAGLAPIIGWNMTHGWVAAGHFADRVGIGGGWDWQRSLRVFSFLGGEVGILGIWWFLGVTALVSAVGRVRGLARAVQDSDASNAQPARDEREGLVYLICLWAVIWTACLVAGLRGESEANWSAPALVSIMVLAGWWLDRQFAPAMSAAYRKRAGWALGVVWTLSMVSLTGLQHTEWFYGLVARSVPPATRQAPAPLRTLDSTNRMRGYREVAQAVDAQVAALRAQGKDPFVLTATYTLAASLSFYMKDQPDTYCLSWTPGLAAPVVNQHDLWHPNPRTDPEAFRGRSVIVVESAESAHPYFAMSGVEDGLYRHMKKPIRVNAPRLGLPVASWDITVCHDFQGLHDNDRVIALMKSMGSPEYVAAHGGTLPGYIRGVYHDLLGRQPTAAELKRWKGLIKDLPPEAIVGKLARGEEYLRRVH